MRVGIIGMGFMGGVHFHNWQRQDGVEVVAVCSTNPIGSKARQGNIAANDDELDLSGVTVYTDIAKMLAEENLDAVSIALPTHLHCRASIQCLKAGIHVLCEKPMALTVEDCDEMIAAAKAAGKELMIAHCIRFWPEYVWLKEKATSGEYGKVLAADFSRLTYAPSWDKNSWFADQAKSGGIALDLHIHDLDYIQSLFGLPHSIQSQNVSFESGVISHVVTSLDYSKNLAVTATASWMMPKPFGFQMAFRIAFEHAALEFSNGKLKIYPKEGEPLAPSISEGDGYGGQINYFSSVLSGGEKDPNISPEQSRESVRISLETVK